MQTAAKKCMNFLALGKVMCMKWGAFKRGERMPPVATIPAPNTYYNSIPF